MSKAPSKAVVAVFKFLRSWRTRAVRPVMGIAAMVAFFATRSLKVLMMVGSRV